MIEVRDTGIVYRNPKPHLRADNTWHPSIVLREDGELLVTFDRGQAPESLDYRTWLTRSADGGHTWSPPVRLIDDDASRRSSHTLRMGQAADGTLMAIGVRFYRDDPEE